MRVLLREVDAVTGATYFTLADRPIARTVEVVAGVQVDVDASGEPVGVEFVYGEPGHEAWHALVDAYPDLKVAFEPHLL